VIVVNMQGTALATTPLSLSSISDAYKLPAIIDVTSGALSATFRYAGLSNGRPYWQADDQDTSLIEWTGTQWVISSFGQLRYSATSSNLLTTAWQNEAYGGDPLPVLTFNFLSLITPANVIEFKTQELSLQHKGGSTVPYAAVRDESANFALIGLRDGEMFFQGSNPNVRIEQGGGGLANLLMRTAKLEDVASDNGHFATIGADNALTEDRSLTVPDESGVLALRNNIGGVVYDFYYSTAPAEATGSSGNWNFTIPSWSNYQLVTMIGAGGGGGSGRVDGAGTVCAGGAGGGSGAFGFFTTRIAGGTEVRVRIGSGGAGGAAQTSAIGNGNAGSTGGDTYIGILPSNTVLLRMSSSYGRGGGGAGGLASLPTAGAAGSGVATAILGVGNNGLAGVAGSLSANAGGGGNANTTQSGRSGGSISAANVAYLGGSLSGAPFIDVRTEYYLPTTSPVIGYGAAGGNASTTANGGNGNNAGIGGGGGGGGAARTGFSSGAGGNGGDGFIRIVCF
jgi:hypothetical protein